MARNNTPISTETKVKKLKNQKGIEKTPADGSDILGAQGFLLAATFPVKDTLICVYQPR